jgi:hypothetical protein
MSTGVVYVVYGEAAYREAVQSIAALRRWHDWPVAVIGDRVPGTMHLALPRRDMGGRWAKLNLDRLAPQSWRHILYLDADTRVNGDIAAGFRILDDGWALAAAYSRNQGQDLMWHVGVEERAATTLQIGNPHPLQIQAGVLFIRRCPQVTALFAAWREEWNRWADQDQAALLRALWRVPVRLWLLSPVWNGGALIAHHFGQARER